MGKDLKKEYMSKQDHDFGAFAPKNNGPSSDMGGAKKGDASTGQGAKGQSENVAQGAKGQSQNAANAAVNKTSEAANSAAMKQGLVNNYLADNAKRTMKADLKASATGEDPEELEAEERQKSQNPAYAAGRNLAKKAAGRSSMGHGFMGPLLGRVRDAFGNIAYGAKTLGANLIGGFKGAATAVTATIGKAGVAVGGLLHTSATVGTVIVVSGTMAAASIPTVGGIGYFVNHYTQRTDGCIPDEYEEESGKKGAEAAVEWAIMIANDDSFNYGIKSADGGYANQCGCYFCGTNDRKVQQSGDERYYKTYVCITFVTAAYAHGAEDPEMLKECQSRHAGIECYDPDLNFTKYHCWTKVGNCGELSIDDLEPGDVIIAEDQHVCMYAGDNNIVEATGGGWDPSSILLNEGCATSRLKAYGRRSGRNIVMRYTGDGGAKSKSSKGSTSADPSHEAFINRIGEAARSLWKPYHIYPSVMVAAACLESAYGTSNFAKTRKNYFGIGAYDSDPNQAFRFKTEKEAMEAYPKVFWSGADEAGYLKVITAHSADDQAMKVHESAYATDSEYYNKLRSIMDAYNLEERFDKGLPAFTPDLSKYGGSVNGSSLLDGSNADYNDEVADMTADDGCGGEMDGAKEEDAYVGKGMVKMTATNGEQYNVLDTDWKEVMKAGHQGAKQCFQFSIAYADLVLGGKFRCGADGEKFRTTYGDGTVNGDPNKIGGNGHNVGSLDEVVKTCIDEVKQGRPVIVHVHGSSYGVSTSGHFVCVVGWTSNAGSSPKWDDLVCIDPAYASHSSDGLHPLKGFSEYGENYVCTFEGWTKP